jgi:hypothetical protein
MVRHTKRRRGGDNDELSSFKTQLNKVEDEVNELKLQLAGLEKSSNVSDKIEETPSVFPSESLESSDSSDEIQSLPTEGPSPFQMESSSNSSAINLMDQSISISGYDGTVGDLMNKVNKKISQLNSPSSKGKYSDKANELKGINKSIRAASSVDEVKSIISGKLTFKNNNLMGGKTKKHRKGGKKGTKRR